MNKYQKQKVIYHGVKNITVMATLAGLCLAGPIGAAYACLSVATNVNKYIDALFGGGSGMDDQFFRFYEKAEKSKSATVSMLGNSFAASAARTLLRPVVAVGVVATLAVDKFNHGGADFYPLTNSFKYALYKKELIAPNYSQLSDIKWSCRQLAEPRKSWGDCAVHS